MAAIEVDESAGFSGDFEQRFTAGEQSRFTTCHEIKYYELLLEL